MCQSGSAGVVQAGAKDMKRSLMHSLFGVASGCALALTLWHGWHYYAYRNTVAAVSAVPSEMAELPADGGDRQPAVLLAQANALAADGQFEAAETQFVRLIDRHGDEQSGQAARFNLANLYLREGLRTELPGATTRALLEIAKQRYRDLLQAQPADWDARYNLELALRASPELARDSTNKGPPPKSVRVIVPDFEADDLP